MKQSGIDWIGEIPDDWNVNKIDSLYILRNTKVSDKDYPPLSVTMQGIVPQLATAAKSDDGDNRKLVKKGDFAINSRSDRRGSSGVSAYDGSVSLINTILTPRGEMNPIYYNWLFHTIQFEDEFYKWGHGIVDDLWTTRWQDMKNIFIVVPPKVTQQRIAEYLDSKCAQIDSIIEESKKSIEEYKAWKQSVIFEAVTGKNLNCKKKDSGIEWIGEIPEGWEVKRLKFASRNRIQKYTSDYGILNYFALENIESQSGRFIETENEYDISQSLICQKNDVVFGKLRPYLAKVYKVNELCCCSGEFAVFYDFEGCPSFFKYYFLSDGFIKIVDSSTYGTKMPRANIDFIKNMLVAIPPLSEQESIAKMLDSKCAQIDSLITEKESLIADLTEYKKSLIFEVVTGKRSI